MIVKIDKMSHDCRGICKINDKVTFISKALPEEILDIRLISEKKNINEGKINKILQSSPDRIIPLCSYVDKCGGCDIAHINYNKQLEIKKEIVIDIMKKYASISVEPTIIKSEEIYNYRNKITLKVLNGKLSLVKENSNELVNIDKCLLVNDKINEIIKLLNSIDINKVEEVIIKGLEEIMVIVIGTIDENTLIDTISKKVKSIILNGKVIFGNEYIKIKVKDITYNIYPKSFFQINTKMIEKLYDKILEYAGKGNSLLDLYCGAGTIGIYLSKNFNKVKGIEVNKDAIISANLNKEINKITNIEFECKKVSDITNITEEVVVVDPPRNGLDKITINKLLTSGTLKIVYVSCNPMTLARDINLLKEKYTLEDITLFDMFPNTKHVESVVLLNKITK